MGTKGHAAAAATAQHLLIARAQTHRPDAADLGAAVVERERRERRVRAAERVAADEDARARRVGDAGLQRARDRRAHARVDARERRRKAAVHVQLLVGAARADDAPRREPRVVRPAGRRRGAAEADEHVGRRRHDERVRLHVRARVVDDLDAARAERRPARAQRRLVARHAVLGVGRALRGEHARGVRVRGEQRHHERVVDGVEARAVEAREHVGGAAAARVVHVRRGGGRGGACLVGCVWIGWPGWFAASHHTQRGWSRACRGSATCEARARRGLRQPLLSTPQWHSIMPRK